VEEILETLQKNRNRRNEDVAKGTLQKVGPCANISPFLKTKAVLKPRRKKKPITSGRKPGGCKGVPKRKLRQKGGLKGCDSLLDLLKGTKKGKGKRGVNTAVPPVKRVSGFEERRYGRERNRGGGRNDSFDLPKTILFEKEKEEKERSRRVTKTGKTVDVVCDLEGKN